ncbi:hypothetical protein Tco_0523788 [Tanacetum coccineum]
MERGFLSLKEKGGGRGVKEKEVGFDGGSGLKLSEDTCPKNNVIGATCSSNNDSGIATYTQSTPHVINTGPISYFNVASSNSSPNGSAKKNGSEQVSNTPVNVVPPLYASKLRLTSSAMANL